MATIQNAHVGYWQLRRRAASERGRRMARARLAKPRERNYIEEDTVRWRELHDRMGKLIFSGWHASRGRIEIRYSATRINGYELWIEGRLIARSGKRKIMEELL